MESELIVRPIGHLRSGHRVKFDARHQPTEAAPETNRIELLPGACPQECLRDLEGFSRIWLVWWFHKNRTWRPLVLPPRGPAKRRGVFATRSPHRPNPIGITPVRLLTVEAGCVWVGACDLLDGTPILDLKPYIPGYDSFPEERTGWMAEVEAMHRAPGGFRVEFAALAHAQAEWLREEWDIDFRPRLLELLSRDPTPHRTRRIRRLPDGRGEIACGAWRAEFVVSGAQVLVERLGAGYPVRFLEDPDRRSVPDRGAQQAFRTRWGGD